MFRASLFPSSGDDPDDGHNDARNKHLIAVASGWFNYSPA
jgi:hypothetical protein